MANSTIKKVVAAFTGSESPALGSEMPETAGMKLPEGKVSTATRKKFAEDSASAEPQ